MRVKAAASAIGVALATMLATSSAHALSLTLDGTTPTTLTDFDLSVYGVQNGTTVEEAQSPLSGLGVDGAGDLYFTFLGKEAGFNNTFEFTFGNVLFTNNSVVNSTTGPIAVNTDTLLDFGFTSNGQNLLKNGDGSVSNASIAFYKLSTLAYLILFNDKAPVGADFDDMAILVQVARSGEAPAPVPLPGALPLLLGGLVGLGVLGRMRKAA